MKSELDWSHERYVRITISGLLTKRSLIPVMADILQHPDYPRKHTLWDLKDVRVGLSISDLKEIVGVLRLYRPREEHFAGRAALVVPSAMNKAIAQMFVHMTKFLPITYQVFPDEASALAFVLEDSTVRLGRDDA